MTAYYPVIEVPPEWALQPEEMGSKAKFWYQQPGGNEPAWLFKYPRENTGEHWAEKIASEVAGLLEIPCAPVELAVFQGNRGVVSKDIVPDSHELVHGNEVLDSILSTYQSEQRNFHLKDHTLENIWLALDQAFDTADYILEAKRWFAGYLMLDAIIGNTDRHSENWGVLRNQGASRHIDYLAPSYDHGSSLGRELMADRRERYLTENQAGWYAERGQGQIYWQSADRHGLSPLQLVRLAAREYPALFQSVIEKLDSLDEAALHKAVASVPEDWMTDPEKTFAIELMRYSLGQLREAI